MGIRVEEKGLKIEKDGDGQIVLMRIGVGKRPKILKKRSQESVAGGNQ